MKKTSCHSYLQFFLLIALNFALSSCWTMHTELEYSDDLTLGNATSKPIYLSIKNTKNNKLYLLLERNINTDEFFIKVRWIFYKGGSQFKGKDTVLKFLIDKSDIISMTPIKPIRIVAYHIDPKSVEEEAIYKITREDFTKLVDAKSVTLVIEGKREKKEAEFNKFHTFRAFKDFLKNS